MRAKVWNVRVVAMACAGAWACQDAASSGKDSDAGQSVEVQFAARVGEQPFACDRSYQLGTPPSAAKPIEMRVYVHDLALVRASGERVPLVLAKQAPWQGEGVALLDFAKRGGSCTGGTKDTRTKVVGSVPPHDDYTGLHFRIGVPSALNHLNAAKQEPPLNNPDLFWSWQDGHILMQVAWEASNSPYWEFNLSESVQASAAGEGCQGSDEKGYTCPNSFQPEVELEVFDAAHDTVKLDLAELFRKVDLTNTDYAASDQLPATKPEDNAGLDYSIGCHMEQWDAECGELLDALGIDYLRRSASDPEKQRFVSKL